MSENKDSQQDTQRDYIKTCFLLTQSLYNAYNLPGDKCKGILLTTLPEITNEEDFTKVENALRGSYNAMKDTDEMSDQEKFVTKQHIECILNIRILHKQDTKLQDYTKNLFSELNL